MVALLETRPSESQIQKLILQWLSMQGPTVMAWRQNAGMMFSQDKDGKSHGIRLGVVGISDIIGIWKGRPLAIEVKKPKGKVTVYQSDFIRRFNTAGGIAFVAHSLEEVQEHLKPL